MSSRLGNLNNTSTSPKRRRAQTAKIETYITKFKSNQPLNKTITPDGKKYSNAYFSNGKFTTVKIKSLTELKRILLKITKNEALGLGIHKDKAKGEITPKARSKELARSKENFKWNEEINLVMLDYDYFEGIKEINSAQEYKEALEEIEPAFKNTQMLIAKSTSSLVVNEKKQSLYKNGGFHCYIFVKGSIDAFKELLWSNCWAKGYGAIKHAADGSILSRTIFDTAVLSPERLVFEALPNIEGNLSLLPKEIKIFNLNGNFMDIKDMESHIDDGSQAEYEAKHNAKDVSLRIKELYIQKHAKILATKTDIEYEVAKKIIEAKTGNTGVFYEDDLIYFPDNTFIQAKELVVAHDGMYILDPIEPDQANAVLNVDRNGYKSIHSFLHGGKTLKIIPAELDTVLAISKEAKELAEGFKNDVWDALFKYGLSEKMYENWKIMFQAYIEASKIDFKTMFIICVAAGGAKTTSLSYFIREKIKSTVGKFSSLIVVNTIQNGIEFKNFLNDIMNLIDPNTKLPRPQIMFAKDKEELIDDEGVKITYTSDVNLKNCTEAKILIITHARLRKAVINGDTEHLMECMTEESLVPKKRDLIVVDEAIDFEEKAIIKQAQSYLVIGALKKFKTFYSDQEIKDKVSKLIQVVENFTDFCENFPKGEIVAKTHEAHDVFGDVDYDDCFDKELLEALYNNANAANVSLESYITDLSILTRSKFFHIDSGGEGIIISSNVDRIPSSKGLVVLDASAQVNHEYAHYVNKMIAHRLRVHLDAKRYDEVSIYKSDEPIGIGKIDVPKSMLNPHISSNANINPEVVDNIENIKEFIQNEMLDKTTTDDEILIISNKSLADYFRTHLAVDRNYHCEHWGNLTGRNDLKTCNKVFCLTLPYKPKHHYFAKAYKHNRVEDLQEVNKFRVSLLIDEVYQALLRANLRTNHPITKNAPKCDIYIRTSIINALNADSQKIINMLEDMLIGVKISKWKFSNGSNDDFVGIPDRAFLMRDVLIEWGKNNPHENYIKYATLHEMNGSVFDKNNYDIKRFQKQKIHENISVLNWIESQTGMKYIKATESKDYLLEKFNITFKGRGGVIFVRNIG